MPQHQGQGRHPARAGAGRGLRRVQQAGRQLDAQGAERPSKGQPDTAAGQLERGAGWPRVMCAGNGNRCGNYQDRPG